MKFSMPWHTYYGIISLQYGVDEVTGVAAAQFVQQSSTSTVRQLEWREDSDYIFIASDDSVRLTLNRIRLVMCMPALIVTSAQR